MFRGAPAPVAGQNAAMDPVGTPSPESSKHPKHEGFRMILRVQAIGPGQ